MDEQTKYLKWYNKVGYGSGDVGGNVVYALLAFFVMIYLTDTMGLNPGIVGTLIMVAKIFDGVSDIIFGVADRQDEHQDGQGPAVDVLGVLRLRGDAHRHLRDSAELG